MFCSTKHLKDQHGGDPTVWRWLNMSRWAKASSYMLREEEEHQQHHKPEAQCQVHSPLPSAWFCPRFFPPRAFKSLRKCSFINKYEKPPNQFKTNRFICSYVIRNTECITVQLILIVSNMLIHAVKTEEMCTNCRRQREIAHRRWVNVSSEILRQDRKHQHGNSGFALHLCLSARINNSNIGGCRRGQTEALITGTTRLFRLCKRSKWIQDLPAGKSFQPEKEQKRSQLRRKVKKKLREKQVWSENMRRWNMRRLR